MGSFRGHFVIGGLGSGNPIGFISILAILIVLSIFCVLGCIKKVGIRTWFRRIILILERSMNYQLNPIRKLAISANIMNPTKPIIE